MALELEGKDIKGQGLGGPGIRIVPNCVSGMVPVANILSGYSLVSTSTTTFIPWTRFCTPRMDQCCVAQLPGLHGLRLLEAVRP